MVLIFTEYIYCNYRWVTFDGNRNAIIILTQLTHHCSSDVCRHQYSLSTDASNVFEQRYKTENNVINQLYPPSVYVSYPLFFWGSIFFHTLNTILYYAVGWLVRENWMLNSRASTIGFHALTWNYQGESEKRMWYFTIRSLRREFHTIDQISDLGRFIVEWNQN